MKKLILMLLLLGANGLSFAQTQNMSGDLTKYWYYRWRLRNDFMVMGEGPGKSLVMQERNIERRDVILFADATLMHGYYLSMLAIEHKILSDLGRYEDLKNNERELYYAMKAVERLDKFAETIYSDATTGSNDTSYRLTDIAQRPCRNGFFFRDDVPPTFLNLNPGLSPNLFTSNYYQLNNHKTGIHYGDLYFNKGDYEGLWKHFDSDEEDGEPPYLTRPLLNEPQFPIVNFEKGRELEQHSIGEESQDQLIRLILGFVTIVKSIPNQEFYIDLNMDGIDDATYNFNEESRRNFTNMIGRLTGHFKGTNEVPVDEVQFQAYAGLLNPPFPWKILNPRYDRTLGGYIGPFKPPMQSLVPMMFTPQNDLDLTHVSQCLGNPSTFYGSLWHTGTAVGYNDFVNAKMALLMNCTSNTGNDNALKTVPRSIYNESKGSGRKLHGFYVPLYDYLWGWNANTKNDKERKAESYELANTWISNAPCVGPHNFARSYWVPGPTQPDGPFSVDQFQTTGAPPYWNTPFLFDNEFSRYDDGIAENGNIAEGWFSGMDYMLLYNLIYANADYERPMYHDLINRVIDFEVNTDNSNQLMEYTSTGLLLGAFEDMHVKSYIHGNQIVEMKALDYVELNNGADIDPSSSGQIHIYTDQITCTFGGNTGVSNPYNLEECQTCGLEAQISSAIAPKSTQRIYSLIPETMPLTIEELNELTEEDSEINSVDIYPNPTKGVFSVYTNFHYSELLIIDGIGRVVGKFDLNNDYDISNLPNGIYMVILINDENEKRHTKIVKD